MSFVAHGPLVFKYMTEKRTNRHIIVISKGCIGFKMICASTIFTIDRTIESLKQSTNQ